MEGQLRPHVRHRALAQRTAGLESDHLALSERPVWGNCAALPQLGRCFDRCVVAMFAANASGRFVRVAVLRPFQLLRHARTAALGKLKRGVSPSMIGSFGPSTANGVSSSTNHRFPSCSRHISFSRPLAVISRKLSGRAGARPVWNHPRRDGRAFPPRSRSSVCRRSWFRS